MNPSQDSLASESSWAVFASKVLQGATIGGSGALILSAIAWYAARKTQAGEVAIFPLMAAGILGGATGSGIVALLRAWFIQRVQKRKSSEGSDSKSAGDDASLDVFLVSLGVLTLLAGVAGALPFLMRWVPVGQKESSPLWSVPLGAAIGLFASGVWSALRQLETGRKDESSHSS
jgi:hypothetical protein